MHSAIWVKAPGQSWCFARLATAGQTGQRRCGFWQKSGNLKQNAAKKNQRECRQEKADREKKEKSGSEASRQRRRTRGWRREGKNAGDIAELRTRDCEGLSERAGRSVVARECEVCVYGVGGEPDSVYDKIQGVATEMSGGT